jgi:hypothetical protein
MTEALHPEVLTPGTLHGTAVPLDRALDLFREKFRLENAGLENAGHVVLSLSLSWFDDAERDPDPPLLGPPSWEEAKAFLVREVRRLASP